MSFLFFFNDTATTEIYTLSLHDALPICRPNCSQQRLGGARLVCCGFARAGHPRDVREQSPRAARRWLCRAPGRARAGDRKSTRLNSSHLVISYAVFCLKKKKVTL